MDFRWTSCGGVLLDGTGDIAMGGADGLESLRDMVRTRLKAALHGWKLYAIGADLENLLGEVYVRGNSAEIEMTIKRQVSRALTTDFLPAGSFRIETLVGAGKIHVFVYANQQLLGSTVVTKPTS